MPLDFTIPPEPIPDPPDNEDSSLFFPILPPEAPKALHTLAHNMSGLLQNIQKLRGLEYASLCTSITVIQQNICELEAILCHCVPKDNPNHQIGHILVHSALNTLANLAEILESSPTKIALGLKNDLNMLVDRLNTDWHDKEDKTK